MMDEKVVADDSAINGDIISDSKAKDTIDNEIIINKIVSTDDVSSSISMKSRKRGDDPSSVWSVNLVDVYTCPRTKQISHTFQVT
jgi:hypothetical protein